MLTLVRAARRRLLCNELLAEGANAGSAALVAFILLLLAGTQILVWYWTLLIPLIALAAGFFRVRRRLPSHYAAAQMVDHRLGLADTISTAFFFEQQPSSPAPGEVRAIQRQSAEQVAGGVDVRQAIPYRMPRTAYAMAALLLVASSLFALRYALTQRLDLSPPLGRILAQSLGFPEHVQQAKAARREMIPPKTETQEDAATPEAQDQKSGDQPNQDAETPSESAGDQTSAEKGPSKNMDNASKKEGEEGDKAEGADGESGDDRPGESSQDGQDSKNGKGDAKQDSGNKQDANQSSDSNSFLNKMKDAMQNLLSKVKPQPNNQNGQQQQSAGDQKQQGKGQQGGKQQGKEGQQQQSGQQGDAQEGQSGEQAQNSQDPQSKGAGKSDSQQASKQPGSGIGSQDGDKSIKQAEQLAAMGKLSEIFGKRSANITGEATVEVQNTSQQLRTPYAQRGAQHSQGGAEISRDEVPVALQSYVEQYFEQVRKQAPPAKKMP